MDPMDKASSFPPDPAPAQGGPPPPYQPTSQPTGGAQQFRWRVFLEPRGFLRGIEFILAVCMFATTAGYATHYSFNVSCAPGFEYTYTISYPFNLEITPLPSICNDTVMRRYPAADPSGSAQYFVAIGVLAMLYTLVISVWYLIFEVKYFEKPMQYTVDLAITLFFTLMFFIASCAWAAGLSDLKYWMDFDKLTQNDLAYGTICGQTSITCETDDKANFSTLNVSVVFGFLNTIVWGGNMWFIYKETSWFRAREEAKAAGAGGNPQTQATSPNTV